MGQRAAYVSSRYFEGFCARVSAAYIMGNSDLEKGQFLCKGIRCNSEDSSEFILLLIEN